MASARSSSGFYLQSNTSSTSASTTSTSSLPLPFPTPLPRSDFLTPHFNPQTYLSSLGHRHQTLEDLRADLRARSLALNQELLDLVNEHYDEFAGLGGSLKGGGEAVEGVKVGVLGLRREVEGVRGAVAEVEGRVGELVEERGAVRREIGRGDRLVGWEGRLAGLERRLMAKGVGEAARGGREEKTQENGVPVDFDTLEEDDEGDDDESLDISSSDDDDEDAPFAAAFSRSKRRVREYVTLQNTARRIGEQHPLIVAQQGRMASVRNTILLDLSGLLKQIKDGSPAQSTALLKVMGLYRDLGAEKEAVGVLKSGAVKMA